LKKTNTEGQQEILSLEKTKKDLESQLEDLQAVVGKTTSKKSCCECRYPTKRVEEKKEGA